MGKITVETCQIEGLKIITPTVFGDARGYFMETYNYNDSSLTTQQEPVPISLLAIWWREAKSG